MALDDQYLALLAQVRAAPDDPALIEALHARYLEMRDAGLRAGNTGTGLPYPSPADPVAEGADAIRTLAEALDARPLVHAVSTAAQNLGGWGMPTTGLPQAAGQIVGNIAWAPATVTIRVPGIYRVSVNVRLSAAYAGAVGMQVTKNSAAADTGSVPGVYDLRQNTQIVAATALVQLANTDVLRLFLYGGQTAPVAGITFDVNLEQGA